MEDHRQLVKSYASGADKLESSIAGLTSDDLLAFPVPGTWSINQIVVHLMDSDLIGTGRMKWVIAEDNPPLPAFDETRFTKSLYYQEQDAREACVVFAKNRRLTAEVLRRLPDAVFERTGLHSERGKVTLRDLVTNMRDHLEHHLRFIHEKRKLLGKPL